MKKITFNFEKIKKVLLTLLIFVLISAVSAALLYAFGIIKFEGGEMRIDKELFDSFKGAWYGAIIIVLLQVVITSLLSFVPGASMAFIIVIGELYENPVEAFIITFSGVMLSSLMMYLIGRYGGYSLCKKIIGEEDCEKASNLLDKGKIYFPMMMMFPVFPDDALVMVAGTLKMSLKWFVPSIVLGRGIGVVTIIFGLSIVPFDKFTTIWHWIGFVLACAVLIVAVFVLANKFNKYLNNKKSKTEEIAEAEKAAAAESENEVPALVNNEE